MSVTQSNVAEREVWEWSYGDSALIFLLPLVLVGFCSITSDQLWPLLLKCFYWYLCHLQLWQGSNAAHGVPEWETGNICHSNVNHLDRACQPEECCCKRSYPPPKIFIFLWGKAVELDSHSSQSLKPLKSTLKCHYCTTKPVSAIILLIQKIFKSLQAVNLF